ncbi:MAG TPA: hypothetical protein PKD24_14650 [Pyrinomonadaceae bacterium]|nr:hypothetical protein [Pyrinomonadaceae bacterium]HMP66613.1 hypothetical protein [Pyrinomonadaceae bacterium]
MNDLKNFILAYFSTVSSVFAAVETRTLITIISAIVLPIIFFTIGKTVDVLLQIYLNRRRRGRNAAIGRVGETERERGKER